MKCYQGFYFPTNKEKYIGNVNNIVYRSRLELHFFNYFDKKKEILKWGSEEITIKYYYSIDKKFHRYFPDLIIHYKNSKNEIKKAIIEIKTSKEVGETLYFLFNKKSSNKEKSIILIEKILKIKDYEIYPLLKEYKQPKRKTKKYINHLNTIIKNVDKWNYAFEFCSKNNFEFYVFTEKDLR